MAASITAYRPRPLRALVLVMGLVGLGWMLVEAVVGRPGEPLQGGPLTRLGSALTQSGDERVAHHLERNRAGAAELLELLRQELPADAVLVSFYATEAEAVAAGTTADRASALGFLGQLLLLLHPVPVLELPPLTPGWTPPPGLPLERLWALDLGYPHPEWLEGLLVRRGTTPAGTLWAPRSRAERRP
jgi:hypothetical protein